MPPVYRAVTVSTYIVGFLSFLAEYFSWHPFHPMFTGLRRGLVMALNLCEIRPTRVCFGNRFRAMTVREWAKSGF